MLVRNIRGFQDRRVPNNTKTWLDFYNRNTSSLTSATCCRCNRPAEVGAHVIKLEGAKEWYLAPLCKDCYEEEVSFNVDEKSLLKVYLM